MTHRGEKGKRSMTAYEKIDKRVPDFVLLMAHNSRGRGNSAACFFLLPGVRF